MNPTDRRLQLDLAGARYLEALERDDFTVMAAVWELATADFELQAILHEIHAGLAEEHPREVGEAAAAALTAAVVAHLPAAEIVRPASGPVTIGDVANELFRHAPDRLSGASHQLNDRLRKEDEPLPENLGLSALTAWGEAKFGPAPSEYWQAFRRAAIKLELRQAAAADYSLAARPTANPKERR